MRKPKATSGDAKSEDAADPRLAQQLIAEGRDAPGLGYSSDPDDSIWIGEEGDLHPDDWIEGHLSPIHSLENVFRAVIDDFPHRSLAPEVRLEQALGALTGFQSRRGRKSGRWATLIEIGEDWWTEHNRTGLEPNLAAIIRRHVPPPSGPDSSEKDQVDSWRDAFNEQKDRILKFVSGRGLDEQAERRRMEGKVIELLRMLYDRERR